MAEFENRTIPEGVNVSETPPLREFAVLMGGMGALVIAIVLAVAFLGGKVARHVSFAHEKAVAAELGKHLPARPTTTLGQQRTEYLQGLADRLSARMALPPEMQVTVHYAGDKTINAMATLGGHIVVYQGLLDHLPNENALAFVLAHEIAHVQHRHPIVAMGRGFSVLLLLSAMGGISDGTLGNWVGELGMLPVLSFNREQESEADTSALEAVYRVYGHVGDADALFAYMASQRDEPPAMLSTHPADQARILAVRRFAETHAPTVKSPATTPLPDFMKTADSGKPSAT